MKIEFRDFRGICERCGSEIFSQYVIGDLIFEDDRIWVVAIYPDYQSTCPKCGEVNKVARIFKATSYERMARGE